MPDTKEQPGLGLTPAEEAQLLELFRAHPDSARSLLSASGDDYAVKAGMGACASAIRTVLQSSGQERMLRDLNRGESADRQDGKKRIYESHETKVRDIDPIWAAIEAQKNINPLAREVQDSFIALHQAIVSLNVVEFDALPVTEGERSKGTYAPTLKGKILKEIVECSKKLHQFLSSDEFAETFKRIKSADNQVPGHLGESLSTSFNAFLMRQGITSFEVYAPVPQTPFELALMCSDGSSTGADFRVREIMSWGIIGLRKDGKQWGIIEPVRVLTE